MTSRSWTGILVAGLILAPACVSRANGCDGEEPKGVGLAELEAMHATALSQTDADILLGDAKRFHELERDESRVLALLLLHRILDGEFPDAAKADALILASEVRSLLSTRHLMAFYKCHELKALDQYIAAHGEGYSFAELWGSYVYQPHEFLEKYLPGLSRDEAIRARFGVYRAVNPCDVFQFDNGCYAPLFSQLAEEAAGTPVQGEVMAYAFEANLNLAACPYASEKARKLGEAAARRWAERLGESAAKALSDYEKGTFKRSPNVDMCAMFNDN